MGGQRGGNRHSLLFAAAQRGDMAVAQMGNRQLVKHLFYPPPHHRRRHPQIFHREDDLVFHPLDNKLAFGVLHHKTDQIGQIARLMG